jgi:hypothetical protein
MSAMLPALNARVKSRSSCRNDVSLLASASHLKRVTAEKDLAAASAVVSVRVLLSDSGDGERRMLEGF